MCFAVRLQLGKSGKSLTATLFSTQTLQPAQTLLIHTDPDFK